MTPRSLEQSRVTGEELMEEVGPSDSGAAMETTMAEPVGTEGEAEALGKRRHGSESSERYFTLLSIKGWSFCNAASLAPHIVKSDIIPLFIH